MFTLTPATYDDFIFAIRNCDARTAKNDPCTIRYYDEETGEYKAMATVSKRWGCSGMYFIVNEV